MHSLLDPRRPDRSCNLLDNSRLYRDSFRRTIGNGYTKGPYTYTRLRIAKGVCPIPGTGMRALHARPFARRAGRWAAGVPLGPRPSQCYPYRDYVSGRSVLV